MNFRNSKQPQKSLPWKRLPSPIHVSRPDRIQSHSREEQKKRKKGKMTGHSVRKECLRVTARSAPCFQKLWHFRVTEEAQIVRSPSTSSSSCSLRRPQPAGSDKLVHLNFISPRRGRFLFHCLWLVWPLDQSDFRFFGMILELFKPLWVFLKLFEINE